MARPRSESVKIPTRERILSMARREFGELGFDRAGLAQIAGAAGIRRSSLLYHFDCKETLYAEVVDEIFSSLTALFTTVMQEPGCFRARTEQLALTFAIYLQDHPHDARVLVRELMAEDGPGQRVLIEQVEPLLTLVVCFLGAEGGAQLREGVQIRAAVLQIASSVLLKGAVHTPLRDALWGDPDPERDLDLVRALLFAPE